MAKPTVSETAENREQRRESVSQSTPAATVTESATATATFARPQNLMKSDYKHDR